jgi:hypothetical protein
LIEQKARSVTRVYFTGAVVLLPGCIVDSTRAMSLFKELYHSESSEECNLDFKKGIIILNMTNSNGNKGLNNDIGLSRE